MGYIAANRTRNGVRASERMTGVKIHLLRPLENGVVRASVIYKGVMEKNYKSIRWDQSWLQNIPSPSIYCCQYIFYYLPDPLLHYKMRTFHSVVAVAFTVLEAFIVAAPVDVSEKRAISSIVSGTPIGFASSVTGGGSATTVYPTTIAELKAYLTSSDPQNIVISGTFNFQGSEGSSTYSACDAYSCTPSVGGQALLNTLNGCGSTSTYSVTIDMAAYQGINVKSNKTLVGKNNAVLYGKGLRFVGVSNIIIQNVAITNLNPKYVWGGDALSFSDTNNIWIDHVTVSKRSPPRELGTDLRLSIADFLHRSTALQLWHWLQQWHHDFQLIP